uniref:Reverse transcriptase domain-containing protein n=1 Tax=Tanacetum cinerariifolium TaxID=118510 RepID=A0A6L2P495_TANCI|nr:hypothetical protein [Tanacetum cinerariifolium]
MDQNIDFSGLDQIQTPQYPVIHHPSQEISEEVFQAKGDLMKSIQTFLEEFNCIPFGEKPKILLQAWDKFFAIQHAQPEDSNILFQKLLKDLQIINKELTECNHPTFFDDNEDHSVQYKEYLENSPKEITTLNSNQEKEKPPQDFDICQLVREECCIEVCEEQKKNMENTMLELIEVCRQKEFYCMHYNVDDLIESALSSKLLLINSKSQRLNKEKQEVKNVVEQPAERRTRILESLQNFRVIHKTSSISLNHTSQISSVHAIAPILPNEEPKYSLSMGYGHLNTTPEIDSDEVTESSAKNLVPIPSEYEVTSDDESECDVPDKDDSSPVFTTFSNPLFNYNDAFTSSDDESLPDEDVPTEEFKIYSNPLFDDEEINSDKIDPHSDFDLEEEIHFVENFLYDNSSLRPPKELNAEITDTIVESLSPSPIPVKDSNSLMDEIDLFLATDELLPPGFKNDDSKGDIHFLKELLIDDSIPLPENESFDHHNNPSFPRPPPKPLDVEFCFDLEPDLISDVIAEEISDKLNDDECFDPEGEINVFSNDEDDDYFTFIFVIRIFLLYLIYPEVSSLLLSAGSEDTIFDPGISV